MDPTLLEALQKHVEGVVQKSVEAMKATLQESEDNVQNTLHVAHEEMIDRIRNQRRNHDEDMRALYYQMMALQ